MGKLAYDYSQIQGVVIFLGFIYHQRLLEESPFWPCKKATAVALPPHYVSHVSVFFDHLWTVCLHQHQPPLCQ